MDNKYYMVGEISVPEDKKAELTENVLQLLYAGGVRKVESINIEGTSYEVAATPVVSSDGKIYFDYSIFEKKKRAISYYDTNLCVLHSEDRGYMEYGVVMNLIMTMIESYSKSLCLVFDENKIYSVFGATRIIEAMIGLELAFPNREKIWEIMLFIKKQRLSNELSYSDIVDVCVASNASWSLHQFLAVLDVDWDIKKPKDYPEGRDEILGKEKHGWSIYYIYELLAEYSKTKGMEQTENMIKQLVEASLEERRNMSKSEETPLSVLAKYSLNLYPPFFVRALSVLKEKSFWDVWDELDITGYLDIEDEGWMNKDIDSSKVLIPLAEIYGFEYEDRFLSLWGKKQLNLSDEINDCMNEWKEQYHNLTNEDVESVDIVEYTKDMLFYLKEVWNCHLLDKHFINELLKHRDDYGFKKLMYMLRNIMDEDVALFPELTRTQVLEWISPYLHYNARYVLLTVFTDALSNKALRNELFGV